MDRNQFLQIVGVWFVGFVLSIFISEARNDTPLIPSFYQAIFWGIFFVVKFGAYKSPAQKIELIESYKSSDGFVVAKIEEWVSSKGISEYRCFVRREYSDRVYHKEEEFGNIGEAKSWLKRTYDQALEKHLDSGA